MEIIIKSNRSNLEFKIDVSNAVYPWQYREAFQKALELDGLDPSTINEIFGIYNDVQKCEDVQATIDEVKEEFPPETTELISDSSNIHLKNLKDLLAFVKSVDCPLDRIPKKGKVINYINGQIKELEKKLDEL